MKMCIRDRIGEAAQIGPFAVLDDGCRVGCNARIRESVLLESSYVGDAAAMTGALLCHGASVRRGDVYKRQDPDGLFRASEGGGRAGRLHHHFRHPHPRQ